MDGTEPAPVVFEWVPSRCGPWPLQRMVRAALPEWDVVPHWPVPTEEHFAEVLALNPGLRGWGEPLP